MEYTFTLEALPIVGGVLIVLVLLICEIGSAGFGTGLPSGGYRYYIGAHTVLYLRQSGCRCRVYVLEGPAGGAAAPLPGRYLFQGVGGLSGRSRNRDRAALPADA